MRMKKLTPTTIIILCIVGAVVVLVGFGLFKNVQNDSGVGGDDNRPDIAAIQPSDTTPYTDLDGNSVSLDQFKGKPLVINTWATWCPFCVNELPDFGELAREFGDDVVVIAMNRREDSARQKAFINSISDTSGIIFWSDDSDFFYKKVGGFSMPETVFYDKDGNVSFHKRGFMALAEMQERTRTIVGNEE